MSARTGDAASAFTPTPGRTVAAARPKPPRPGSRLRERSAADRHSRRVALLKRLLPVVGLALLTLVAIWPRLGPLLESVRLAVPRLDLREAGELRMVNPRYAGLDRFNKPYVVTATVGRQVPNRDDLMALEQPRAEMTMHNGAVVVVSAATAMYQAQTQLLDLFDDVTLVHENGTRFVTSTAHVDVAASTAEGHDPVSGHGPAGDVAAQGFRIIDKGDTVFFTGKSHLVLKGTQPSPGPVISPPRLPAEVEEAAARIEAMAAEQPAAPSVESVGTMARAPASSLTEPAPSLEPVAQSRAVANARP